MKRRKKERARAIVILLAAEMLMASLAGGIVAAIAMPVAYHARGYFLLGGEWLLIYLTTMAAYHIIHGRIFKPAHKRKRGGANAGSQTARRTVRGHDNPSVYVGRSA